MKCAIFIVSIGENKIFQIALKSIRKYCDKFDIDLIISKQKKLNLQGIKGKSRLIFEKSQVVEHYKAYDQILRLDNDIIITPKCPNLFDIIPYDKIGCVYEDKGSRRRTRKSWIRFVRKEWGNVGWNRGFLNGGVMVASREHKKIFKVKSEDIENINKLRMNEESIFLNYKIRQYNFPIMNLSYKFNHMPIFSEAWNGYANRFESYIIHYAGRGIFDSDLNIQNKFQQAKFDWKLIQNPNLKEKYKRYRKQKLGIKFKFPFLDIIIQLFNLIFDKSMGLSDKFHLFTKIIYQIPDFVI